MAPPALLPYPCDSSISTIVSTAARGTPPARPERAAPIDQHPFDVSWTFGIVRAHGTTKLIEHPDGTFGLEIEGRAEHVGGPTNIDFTVPVSGNTRGEREVDTPLGKFKVKYEIAGWDLQPRSLGLLLTVSITLPVLGERTPYDKRRFAGQRRALGAEATETMLQRCFELQRQLGDELGITLT